MKETVFKPLSKPPKKISHLDQGINTLTVFDTLTGEKVVKSGLNVRSIITEQFKTASFNVASANAIDSTSNVVTIPDNKICLLVSANLCASSNATTSGNATLRYSTNGGGSTNTILRVRTLAIGTATQALNTPVILVFPSGTIFEVVSDATTIICDGVVHYYLISPEEYLPASSISIN